MSSELDSCLKLRKFGKTLGKIIVEMQFNYDYYFSLYLGEMAMAHIFIGAFTTAVFLLVIISARKKGFQVKWWQLGP